MAELTELQKTFIVQALACYDSPSQVVTAVKEEFAVVVTRQQVECYDHTKAAGRKLSKKWIAIFNATREGFENETAKIPIALRATRIRRLERYANAAEKSKNYVLAAQFLEQIAKEVGGAYENKRLHVLSGPNGGAIETHTTHDIANMPLTEVERRIAELEAKNKGIEHAG